MLPPFDELERTWLLTEAGQLRTGRFLILYAYPEITNGGYGLNVRYVVQLRERGDVCAECGADFKKRIPECCKNDHWPDRSYRQTVNAIGFTRDQAAERALEQIK